jgi:hypothetical protein
MAKNNGATLGFEETLWQAAQVELEVPFWRLEFRRMRSLDE